MPKQTAGLSPGRELDRPSSAGLSPGRELDRPSSDCFLAQLQFRPLSELPTQSYICLLGGLLAILDLDELAPRPITDGLMSHGTSLVMGIGQRLVNLVGRYVHYLCVILVRILYMYYYGFIGICYRNVFKLQI